jgi:cyanophycin synthetase
VRDVGRRCAGLDYVILKEDENRRGRAPGQIVRLIAEGLAEVGIGPERTATVYSERDAVSEAVRQMGDRDLVVILVDDVAGVLEQLRPLRAGG